LLRRRMGRSLRFRAGRSARSGRGPVNGRPSRPSAQVTTAPNARM
jgi:hypothetical protein